MVDFVDRHFKEEAVDLGGNSFRGCTFENCKLRYDGGSFELFEPSTVLGRNTIAGSGNPRTIREVDKWLHDCGGIELTVHNPHG
jgi:hypothetical protein